ncbi:uncharacterized protein LOC132624353 [Lycium barbarum]|uniref:uncharacterized protein LOC132624353 n=1 Tax=Lycium barbarum TaxID=112863 RepID=UPI00293E3539|nr:uncharacterized protein LOC132624353 [Lycium barbarum]
MEIGGSLMRIFKWSRDFDPNEETSLAPVWVLLPGLKFHLFKWEYLRQILTPIGIPLKEDSATTEDDGVGKKGYEQKLEYEGVPAFCKSCRMQGHEITKCKVEARKKDQKELKKEPQKEGNKRDRQNNKQANKNKNKQTQNHNNYDANQNTKEDNNKNKTNKKSKTNVKQIPTNNFMTQLVWAKQRLKQTPEEKNRKGSKKDNDKDTKEKIIVGKAVNIDTSNNDTKRKDDAKVNQDKDRKRYNQHEDQHSKSGPDLQKDTSAMSGQLFVDLGPVEIPGEHSSKNRHGPNLEQGYSSNNTIMQEGEEDSSEDELENPEYKDEEEDREEGSSDEEVAECLIKTFAPKKQDEEDPVTQEITKVVSRQGLSPRGQRKIKKKQKRKGSEQPSLSLQF